MGRLRVQKSPWTDFFGRWWIQVCAWKAVEWAVRSIILLLMKTPRSLQTVHWQRRWVCWKIKICSFVYLSFKWVRLKTFWPPLVLYIWSIFCSGADRSRLDAFMRRAKKLDYCADTHSDTLLGFWDVYCSYSAVEIFSQSYRIFIIFALVHSTNSLRSSKF